MTESELEKLSDSQLYELVRTSLIRHWLGFGNLGNKYANLIDNAKARNPNIYFKAVEDAIVTITTLQMNMDGLKVINIKRIDYMNEEELMLFIQSLGAAVKHDIVDTSPPSTTTITDLIGIKKGSMIICEVSGDSMLEANIGMGDRLFVDTSQQPADNDIIVAVFNNEMYVKRLRIINKQMWLYSENPKFKPFKVKKMDSLNIMGVVKFVLRKAK